MSFQVSSAIRAQTRPNTGQPTCDLEVSGPIQRLPCNSLGWLLSRFFRFLQGGEFAGNSLFDPELHISMSDIRTSTLSYQPQQLQDPHENVQRWTLYSDYNNTSVQSEIVYQGICCHMSSDDYTSYS